MSREKCGFGDGPRSSGAHPRLSQHKAGPVERKRQAHPHLRDVSFLNGGSIGRRAAGCRPFGRLRQHPSGNGVGLPMAGPHRAGRRGGGHRQDTRQPFGCSDGGDPVRTSLHDAGDDRPAGAGWRPRLSQLADGYDETPGLRGRAWGVQTLPAQRRQGRHMRPSGCMNRLCTERVPDRRAPRCGFAEAVARGREAEARGRGLGAL